MTTHPNDDGALRPAVTRIEATFITLECPSCGQQQEGFLSDPRGGEYTCDDCSTEYVVTADADVALR